MAEILAGTGWAVQEFIPSPGPSYIATIVKLESASP